MKDISATQVARNFSSVLDSVEHGQESFRVMRGGKPVARITPVGIPNGREVAGFLRANRPDPHLADDIEAIRAMLRNDPRAWPG